MAQPLRRRFRLGPRRCATLSGHILDGTDVRGRVHCVNNCHRDGWHRRRQTLRGVAGGGSKTLGGVSKLASTLSETRRALRCLIAFPLGLQQFDRGALCGFTDCPVFRTQRPAQNELIGGRAEGGFLELMHADVERVEQRGYGPTSRVCFFGQAVSAVCIAAVASRFSKADESLVLFQREHWRTLRLLRRVDEERDLPVRHGPRTRHGLLLRAGRSSVSSFEKKAQKFGQLGVNL